MSHMFQYDSDEDSRSSYSSDDSEPGEKKPSIAHAKFQAMSSESEDERRVVKSAKEKMSAEVYTIRKNLSNHKKIKDNSKLSSDFDDLLKLFDKSRKSNNNAPPGFFIKELADLEEYIKEAWDNKKNLSKVAAKFLTALKQKVKKVSRDFEKELADYSQNPNKYNDDSEENESKNDLDEVPIADIHPADLKAKKLSKKKSKLSVSETETSDEEEDHESRKKTVSGDETGSSSDSFGADSGSEESTDSSDDSAANDPLNMEMYKDNPAAYFLKVNVEARAKEKARKKAHRIKKPKKSKEERSSKRHTAKDEDDAGGDWLGGTQQIIVIGEQTETLYGEVDPSLQAFEKGVEITPKLVIKRLEEIMSDRGKSGISSNDLLYLLLQIEKKIDEMRLSIGLHAKVLMCLITVLFDYSAKHQVHMPNIRFQKSLELFGLLFDLIENNPSQIIFCPNMVDTDEEELVTQPFQIQGSVLLLVSALDDEYTKILRNVNGHESEYIEQLRDERKICTFLDRLCTYLESIDSTNEIVCSAYIRKIEHLYYKFDFDWAKNQPEWADDETACDDNLHHSAAPEHESVAEMRRLCEFIYTNDLTNRLRTRAILCHIYHLALYGYWFRARDLMLMSNLQSNIDHADHATMLLYNRAMVQLGLCAFRQGQIRDAHNALVDIIGSNRVKELLAQQMTQNRYYERSPEEEARERAMQIPYHMHINTDLLECVYLVSTMLLEIPLLAAHETDMRWRLISKAFHQALRTHDRAILSAPPESSRDHVIMAAKSMRIGNWKQCIDYLVNPKMDSKIWMLFFHPERIKKMLVQRVKEESLRSYLFMYSAVHDSISLDRLAEHFEIPKSLVYSIISRMIINQDLAASLEVPSDYLIMHKTERSRLQTLALQLADKVTGIVEMNEKLMDNRANIGPLNNKGFTPSYQGRVFN